MPSYNIISKFYDLLDTLYFRRVSTNPRNAINQILGNKALEIIDICTGTAANAICIAQRNPGAKITGIDISSDMLKIAGQKVSKAGLSNVELYEADAANTGFESEAFDIAVLSLVLHEINSELTGKILAETKRILRKNGMIIVMEWEKPRSIFQRIMFLPIRIMEPKGFKSFLDLDSTVFFRQYGLCIADIKHCDYTKVLALKMA